MQPPVPSVAPADECVHEMLRASCIWCTPRAGVVDVEVDLDAPARADHPTSGPWLVAAYHGDCAGCREPIAPGDSIQRRGRAYVCEECGHAD